MKALKILLYVVLGLGALWMLLGLFAKKDYRIERSAEIDAPREIVYEQLRFFKNLPNWSPWHVYDPNMKTAITGTDGEAGAVYSWEGNDKVGKGTQTLKSVSPGRIDVEVDFGWTPSPAYFQLEEAGKKTKVTWAMDMHVAFPWNAFSMLTDVNAFVGKDFENGLINLKKVCENIAHPKYRGYEVAEAELPLKYYLGVRQVVAFPEVSAFFDENLPKLMEMLTAEKLTLTGAPVGLFWSYDEKAGQTDMAVAIPVAEEKKLSGVSVFPAGGRALTIDYFGPYDKTGEAHYAMDDYMTEKNLRNIPPVIEEYITDPAAEPDTMKWLTKIIYFVEPESDSTAAKKK